MSARTSVFRVLACTLAMATAHAETLYVIEQLEVDVSSSPDGNGDRVASIRGGDRVELLERSNGYALVRVESGAEGWIPAAYLSSELPLRNRLNQRTQELERARREVERLQTELAAAQRAASSAAEEAETLARQVQEQAARLEQDQQQEEHAAATGTPSLFMARQSDSPRPAWQWVVGSAAVSLGCGFLLGWRTLDRRIRRKYGGLRIY